MMPNTSVLTNFNSPSDVNSQKENTTTILSHDSLDKQPKVPKGFTWSLDEISQPKEKLEEIIDLEGFFKGDKLATEHAANLLRAACLEHGFFQVINHGIDQKLLDEACDSLHDFFKLPSTHKLRALIKPGGRCGFSPAHTEQFSTNLSQIETLVFPYHANDSNSMVVHYFTSVFGNEWEPMGMVFQKYCEAMNNLCFAIMELLALSLGVERSYYKDFFEEAQSTLRLMNYYPRCGDPSLVLGVVPHRDPNSLTIIHQDQIGGLEVFANEKWQRVEPRPDALFINIGDTFVALSNGQYKSCLHRVVANENKERKSMGFFFSPKEDKVVRPPEIISKPRKYPDFTWSDLVSYSRKYYHPDEKTLQSSTEKYYHNDEKKSFLDSFFTSNSKSIP